MRARLHLPRSWLLTLAVGLFLAALAADEFDRFIARTPLPTLLVETSVEVQARDGTLLRAYTVSDGRWRLPVTLEQVDPLYLQMLIAYEDKRFFQHNGLDSRAFARAIWQGMKNGRIVSGASTLSMQVARLIEDGPTGTWGGKARQMRLALALERQMSKEDILTLYLNRAPFGGNLEGVRAASLAYFGKEPYRLTVAEAALLVALPQSPEKRRPDRASEATRIARDGVLARMVSEGVIDEETASAARREPVPMARRDFPLLAPHLADRFRLADPQARLHRLTIDAAVQKGLEDLARKSAQETGIPRVSVAILAVDVATGEVVASVGAGDFGDTESQGFVDMTTALRSPGSTLKPFVYGLAFDFGLAHPESLIDDVPTRFGDYAPQNFDGEFHGRLSLRHALQQSLNIPAVALTEAVTPARLLTFLHAAGAKTELPGSGQPGLAVVLGGIGISLEDLVRAYLPLANGGFRQDLVYRADEVAPRGVSLMGPNAVWQVGDILKGIRPPGGALPDRVAWKTGTSYGHRDAWAIGFDGAHLIGVWIGRPDGTPVPGAFGAESAAPILFDAFARLKPRLTPLPPPPPSTLIVANADLPPNLREFKPRDAAFREDPDAPDLIFPPDGAVLAFDPDLPLSLKVRNGRAPFTWLIDGLPALVGSDEREVTIPFAGPGFYSIAVIDALGRSERVAIRLQ